MNNYTITNADMTREDFVDNGDGTGIRKFYDAAGTVTSFTVITGLPPFQYPPLDPTGALATLLVVENVLALADASNAIQEEPAHLIAEAEAWSLGNG